MNYLFLLLISLNIHAQNWFEFNKTPGSLEYTKGKQLKDAKDRKSNGEISAQVVLTDEQEIFERWKKPSEGFSIHQIKEVEKGTYFYPLVLFGGGKADSKGNLNVTYLLRVLRPDGSQYFEETFVGWKRQKSPYAILSENYLKISFDPPDVLGRYTFQIFLKDENANSELKLETYVDLIERKKKIVSKLSEEEINRYLTYYYLKKDPSKLFDLIAFIDSNPGFNDQKIPFMHFFEHVFRGHKSKIKRWEKDFSKFNPSTQQMIWDGLWLSDTKESMDSLKRIQMSGIANQKYILTLLSKPRIKLISEPVLTPGDMDKNWMSFSATGDTDYVLNVMRGLSPISSNNRENLMMKGAAMFSLSSNCKQHTKVKSFLKKYVKNDSAANVDIIKKMLAECK